MSLINMTLKHGRGLDQARGAMDQAVRDLQTRFGPLVRRVDWDADRTKARVEGVGFWVEMRIDAQDVHVAGDVPILGGLLGGPLGGGIKQILRKSFPALPGRTTPDPSKDGHDGTDEADEAHGTDEADG